jgi:1-acyl-sn-glycerol-3-phosphate acyltransferase
MQTKPSTPPKPVSRIWHPELTRLPRLGPGRRFFRSFMRMVCRFLVFICTRVSLAGMENFPRKGPALVVTNHLGDADLALAVACLPAFGEILAKIEVYEMPVIGALMDAFGMIWVHRGQPDRKALRLALEALRAGRFVGIAPEGRESLTGGLEPATSGAAFLALHAHVPLVPVTFTGTENHRLLSNLRRLRRTPVSLTVGKPFVLPDFADRRTALREATRFIMEVLSRQLPPELRGAYAYVRD